MREGEGGGPLAEQRRDKVEEVVVQGIFHFCYTYLLGIVLYLYPGEMESDCSFFFFSVWEIGRSSFLSLFRFRSEVNFCDGCLFPSSSSSFLSLCVVALRGVEEEGRAERERKIRPEIHQNTTMNRQKKLHLSAENTVSFVFSRKICRTW